MRYLAACLLLVACSHESSPGGAGGSSGATEAGKGGRGGAGAAASGTEPVAGQSANGGAGQNGSAGQGGGAGQTSSAREIRLVPNVVSGVQKSGSVDGTPSEARVGAGAMTLRSLKYYVTSIQLCSELENVGSGFSNPRGCIAIYENQDANSPSYDTYKVRQAIDDTHEGRYIDLMSSAGQEALRKPKVIQLQHVQDDSDSPDAGVDDLPPHLAIYRYGLINFYRPIKVTAEFPILGDPDSRYFRTRAVSSIHTTPSPNGGLDNDRVHIGDTLSGATEETTYMLNNGGALFTFQKPFVITQADVDNKAEIKIDLVFNPENFGQAYDSHCADAPYVAICDTLNNVAIDMPFVHMSPVPRKAGERTRKETYMLDYEANAKLRIELYYNDADPEAGIQGVDTAIVYGPGVPSMFSGNVISSNFVSQTGSVRSNDASVRLLDYRRMTNLSGLRRRQNGTATVHCLFAGSFCSSLGSEVSKAYSYVGDSVVSSN